MVKLVNKEAERLNPCLQEQEASYACLSKNGYEQAKCVDYFENYNTCKKFWGQVYRDRKAKGIMPFLPEAEERAQIKEDFIKSVRSSTQEQKKKTE